MPETNAYDRVPYPSHPFPHSRPSHLATLAALLSVPAPPAAVARVLELGSAAGGNLIPMAFDNPEARFIGVDSSKVEVDEGRRLIGALALPNIELRHADIREVDRGWGEFDYIICHGVYSWVSTEVQGRILELASDLLGADGIAYISYNTLPGWHGRAVARELMRFRTRRIDDPVQAVAEARRSLDAVSAIAQSHAQPWYRALLDGEARMMREKADAYVCHDNLSPHCEPCYFRDFIERAATMGLEYLGEPELVEMATADFGARTGRTLDSLARNTIELEQIMDFCTNRTFRRTLLRRAGRRPQFQPPARALWPMHIACGAAPREPIDPSAAVTTEFINREGESVAPSLPLLAAALGVLSDRWPASVAFESLIRDAAGRLGLAVDDVQRTLLGRGLLGVMTRSHLIEVSLDPPRFATDPAPRPTASRLARSQAGLSRLVTNRRHETVELSQAGQHLIQTLDGTRTPAEAACACALPEVEARDQVGRLARNALLVT